MKQEDLDLEKAIELVLAQYAAEDQERRKDDPDGWKRGQWLREVSGHLAFRVRLAIQKETQQ